MPLRPPLPRLRTTTLLALLALGTAHAADPPAAGNGWRAGTKPAAPAEPLAQPAGQLQVRVYEGFGTLGPVYGAKDDARAVDVAVGLVTCPDGDTEIGAMNIGGMRYDVAGTCRDAGRGSVTVEGAAPSGAAPVAAAGTAPAAGGVIRCDPGAWRCTSSAPPAADAPAAGAAAAPAPTTAPRR